MIQKDPKFKDPLNLVSSEPPNWRRVERSNQQDKGLQGLTKVLQKVILRLVKPVMSANVLFWMLTRTMR
jgi:hypothetical protein